MKRTHQRFPHLEFEKGLVELREYFYERLKISIDAFHTHASFGLLNRLLEVSGNQKARSATLRRQLGRETSFKD